MDVTPRRLQQFTVQAGVTYTWENTRADDGTVLQSGTVTADADQLITITGFEVSEAGNRLTIRPQ